MAAIVALSLIPVAVIYTVRAVQRRRRRSWEAQGPLYMGRTDRYCRRPDLLPPAAPSAQLPPVPAWAAGGELHVSVLELQVLDGRKVGKWFGRDWRRSGAAGRPWLEVQLGTTILSSSQLPVQALLTGGDPETAPASAYNALPADPTPKDTGFFRLPLQEGQRGELQLFLYQQKGPGGRNQRLRAAARVPLAAVFNPATGADAVTVPLFSRRGTVPLALRVGMSYVSAAQVATAAAKAAQYGAA